MLALWLTTLAAAPTLADDANDQVKLETFLSRPFETFEQDHTPGGFRIIALSNLAEYCGRRGHERCLRRTAAIALDSRLSPFGKANLLRVPLGDHGVYLAHLGVILTELRGRLNETRHDRLLRRVVRHLVARSEESSDHHMASYPRRKARYPADQAVVLFVLHRYDELFNSGMAAPLVRNWLIYMATQGASRNGLHRSEITGAEDWGHQSRGCALSWTVRYMAAFAPEAAEDLWRRYKKRHAVNGWLVSGFREWPVGVDRPADHDSGPIIMGIGVAASAFAIGASRAVGDLRQHHQLVRSMAAVRRIGGPALETVVQTILARAIALNGSA